MKIRVPLFDLGMQNRPVAREVIASIKKLIDGNMFILGKAVSDFEEAAAKFCGSPYAVGVSSGTDALLVSMTALGIGPGDIVITPVYTFLPTAGSATRLGATVRFIDADEENFNMDPQKLEDFLKKNRNIMRQVKAVVPVHLYGQCADMKAITLICRTYGIPVIEDAAQAIGTISNSGKSAGTMGILGCLSFYPTKNLGAMGDAGMVLTSDKKLYEKLIAIRNHGSGKKRYLHESVGGNFRIDAFQAAVLSIKLKSLKKLDRMRVENARRYKTEFEKSGLTSDGTVSLPSALNNPLIKPSNRSHLFNQYCIHLKRRDALRNRLLERGIQTETYYPIPLHLQPCYRNLGYKKGDFPVAEKLAAENVALPIYPGLKAGQIKIVVNEIARFFKGK